MEINPPAIPIRPYSFNPIKNTPENFKLYQQIDVKVLSSDILKNELALQLADKTLHVQTNQALNPTTLPAEGAVLKLQVVKLVPALEFKILSDTLNTSTTSTPNLPGAALPASELRLRLTENAPTSLALLSKAPLDSESTPSETTSLIKQSTAQLNGTSNTLQLSSPLDLAKLLRPGQVMLIRILDISPEALRFELLPKAPAQNFSGLSNPTLNPPSQPAQPSLPSLATPSNASLTPPALSSSSTLPTPITTPVNPPPPPLSPSSRTTEPTQLQNPVNALPPSAQPALRPPQNPEVLTIPLKQVNIDSSSPTLNSLALKPGQTLEIQVNQLDKSPSFKILASNQFVQASQTQKVTETLRHLLPQQIPTAVLLNELIKHLPGPRANESVPEALQRIAVEIFNNLPDEQQLTNPLTLKKSLENSGLFLEAKLPQLLNEKPPELAQDFKLNLLKLLVVIKEHLGQAPQTNDASPKVDVNLLQDLQQKTEGSVAKLVLDQLASLPKDDTSKQVWNLEIPFVNQQGSNKIDIEIEQDQGHSGEDFASPSWSVTLTLTPPGLGTIHCKVSYIDNTINTYFRSEHLDTLSMVERHLDQLREQFEAAGLHTGYMSTQEGNFKKNLQEKLARKTLFSDKA